MRFKFHIFGSAAVSFINEGCLVYVRLHIWRVMVEYWFQSKIYLAEKNLMRLIKVTQSFYHS